MTTQYYSVSVFINLKSGWHENVKIFTAERTEADIPRPGIIRILFIMPMIQLLILPLAADYEIKNINLGVVDHDHSEYSRKLVNKIVSSGYFRLKDYSPSFNQGLKAIELDKTDLILEIPTHFERDLVNDNKSTLFCAVDAINGVKAGLGGAYIQQIIQDYNQDVRMQWIQTPLYNRSQPLITFL
jgi:ABC-2 type transport system permease protein